MLSGAMSDRNAGHGLLTAADCRVWERVTCDVELICQPIAARAGRAPGWPARVRDISSGGVGLVVSRRFEPGAGLAIEVPGTASSPSLTLLARVVRATAVSGDQWVLGCSFPSPLSDEELEGMLTGAQAEEAAAPE